MRLAMKLYLLSLVVRLTTWWYGEIPEIEEG